MTGLSTLTTPIGRTYSQSIYSDPSIKGLDLAGHQHNLCLFDNDILIFMSSLHISAPNLIRKRDHFAHISGLTINPQKSNAKNISLPLVIEQLAQTSLPFSWSNTHLSYLGINLTPSISDIFTDNFPPILRQITNLLTQRLILQLSWIGKINVIKMAILPKVLYVFQVLPIPVPAYCLRILQRKKSAFVWGSL